MSNADKSLAIKTLRKRRWRRERAKVSGQRRLSQVLQRYERILVVIGAIALFLGTAFFASRPADEVNFGFVGRAEGLTFSSPRGDALRALMLTDAVISPIRHIEVFGSNGRKILGPSPAGGIAIKGTVSLWWLPGTPNTTYELKKLSSDGTYTIDMDYLAADRSNGLARLILSVQGTAEIETLGTRMKVRAGTIQVYIDPKMGVPLSTAFTVKANEGIKFAQQIPLSTLKMYFGEAAYQYRHSTILDGSLRVFDLPEKLRQINEGECFMTADPKGELGRLAATVSSLRVRHDDISIALTGRAADALIGVCSSPTSIKPNTLEIWQQNNQVSIIWGAFATAFGLLFAVMKWLLPKES